MILCSFFLANAIGKETRCVNQLASCNKSETAKYVEELAEDKDRFIEEFIDVYTKMLDKVNHL